MADVEPPEEAGQDALLGDEMKCEHLDGGDVSTKQLTWKQLVFTPFCCLLVFSSVLCFMNANAQYILDRTCSDSFGQSCHALSDADRRVANAKSETLTSIVVAVPNSISLFTAVYLSVQGRK